METGILLQAMMEQKNITLGVSFISVFVLLAIASVLANELVDPTVEAISNGPKEYGVGESYNFMVILTVNEIYYHVYVQEITFGDEGCCKKVKRVFQIKDEDLSGRYAIKSFETVKWLNPTSFIITINGNEMFAIKDLDKDNYKVESYKVR